MRNNFVNRTSRFYCFTSLKKRDRFSIEFTVDFAFSMMYVSECPFRWIYGIIYKIWSVLVVDSLELMNIGVVGKVNKQHRDRISRQDPLACGKYFLF